MSKLAACLRAADARFPALSAAPELLQLLDAFLERAARAQTQREPLAREAQAALSADAPHVLLLLLRAAALLPPTTSTDDGDIVELHRDAQLLLDAPLHAARVVPFCLVFARSNGAAVARVLDALAPHAERFGVRALQCVFREHLRALHALAQQDKRTQVLDAIHSIHEVALSLSGLLASEAFAATLLLERGADVEMAFRSDSLLRALVVCYDADLPVLQRHVAKLDDAKAQGELQLIAETRQLLLQTLGHFMNLLLSKQGDGNHDEVLLEVLHTMSHCCDDEDADQGSYLSDLWYLCNYKDKISSFLESGETDTEHLSYLEMIVDALPRRRIVSAGLDPSEQKPSATSDSRQAHDESHAANDFEEKEAPPSETSSAADAVVNPLVLQVKDFFPDLGDGYIELCLLSSENQLETVINFLLESNPPPVLLEVPQSLQRSDREFAVLEAKLTGKAPPPPPQAASKTKSEEKKLDPSRVWIGKKPQEKTYDPQLVKRDSALAEKTKKIAKMIEEEEELMAGVTPFLKLDEYDDDYNDEFEDYEPFGVKDSGQGDGQDSIRLQNRLMRAREAEDAFWESMRNVNRLQPANNGEEINEDAEKKLLPNAARAAPRRAAPGSQPKQPGSAPNKDAGGEQQKKSGQQGGKKAGQGASTGANGKANAGAAGAAASLSPSSTGAGEGAAGAAPMTKEQELRARARSSKNKAKVANHHRKERALKKQG